MLLLKPNCESCSKPLSASQHQAKICSFECTFCLQCSAQQHQDICPNCKGELLLRPTRAEHLLDKYPPQTSK